MIVIVSRYRFIFFSAVCINPDFSSATLVTLTNYYLLLPDILQAYASHNHTTHTQYTYVYMYCTEHIPHAALYARTDTSGYCGLPTYYHSVLPTQLNY